MVGSTLVYLGQPAAALPHLEQSIAHYDPQLQSRPDVRLRNRPRVRGDLARLAWALWLLGYPDRSADPGHRGAHAGQGAIAYLQSRVCDALQGAGPPVPPRALIGREIAETHGHALPQARLRPVGDRRHVPARLGPGRTGRRGGRGSSQLREATSHMASHGDGAGTDRASPCGSPRLYWKSDQIEAGLKWSPTGSTVWRRTPSTTTRPSCIDCRGELLLRRGLVGGAVGRAHSADRGVLSSRSRHRSPPGGEIARAPRADKPVPLVAAGGPTGGRPPDARGHVRPLHGGRCDGRSAGGHESAHRPGLSSRTRRRARGSRYRCRRRICRSTSPGTFPSWHCSRNGRPVARTRRRSSRPPALRSRMVRLYRAGPHTSRRRCARAASLAVISRPGPAQWSGDGRRLPRGGGGGDYACRSIRPQLRRARVLSRRPERLRAPDRARCAVPARAVARRSWTDRRRLVACPGGRRRACSTLLDGGAPAVADPEVIRPNDVALLLHTAGTTSRPKGVPLTHHNLCVSAHNMALALALDRGDRCLNVLPLFHMHGLMGPVLVSMTAGASVVVPPTSPYRSSSRGWTSSARRGTTAVPTIHQALLAHAAANPGTSSPSAPIHQIGVGAAVARGAPRDRARVSRSGGGDLRHDRNHRSRHLSADARSSAKARFRGRCCRPPRRHHGPDGHTPPDGSQR